MELEQAEFSLVTEQGQYHPVLGSSNGLVTKIITLAHPGVSLDRMSLAYNMGTGPYSGSFWTAANVQMGYLVAAYLSGPGAITLLIKENVNAGTSEIEFCWEVRRW